MKIAIVGKGGSGKSSISWLITQYLERQNKDVLAIDADHNMDLMTLLLGDQEFQKYLYKSQQEVRKLHNLQTRDKWRSIYSKPAKNKTPAIEKLYQAYSINISPSTQLCVLGLGDDLMYIDMCSHAHTAVLKYTLPFYHPENKTVVMDSVAGADMINYGLYASFDIVLIAVEQTINSIKVAKQLHNLLSTQGTNTAFVINKYSSNKPLPSIIEEGTSYYTIPSDPAFLDYNTQDCLNISQKSLTSMFSYIDSIQPMNLESSYNKLKSFDLKKVGHVHK